MNGRRPWQRAIEKTTPSRRILARVHRPRYRVIEDRFHVIEKSLCRTGFGGPKRLYYLEHMFGLDFLHRHRTDNWVRIVGEHFAPPFGGSRLLPSDFVLADVLLGALLERHPFSLGSLYRCTFFVSCFYGVGFLCKQFTAFPGFLPRIR
jgi:hypothetical protein